MRLLSEFACPAVQLKYDFDMGYPAPVAPVASVTPAALDDFNVTSPLDGLIHVEEAHAASHSGHSGEQAFYDVIRLLVFFLVMISTHCDAPARAHAPDFSRAVLLIRCFSLTVMSESPSTHPPFSARARNPPALTRPASTPPPAPPAGPVGEREARE